MSFDHDPEPWAQVPLNELVLRIEAGRSFGGAAPPAGPAEWGVVKVSAMTWGAFKPEENKRVPTEAANPKYEIRANDLLLSRANTSDYVGASVLVGASVRTRLLLSDKSLRLVPADGVDPRWLQFMLASPPVRSQISQRATGTKDSMRNISQASLLDIRVPRPTLAEQHRIVELLEDHLSRLDAAHDYVAAAHTRLRAWRLSSTTSVLSSAEVQRSALKDVLDFTIGGVWGDAPGVDNVDVHVLRVTELQPGGRLRPATAATRSVSAGQLRNRELQRGDLLLEKSGGGPRQPVGRVGLVEHLDGPSVCSNFMQLMRPNRFLIRPEYLHLYLNDLHERGGTEPLQTASTNIRNIKASDYLRLQVPVPSLDDQDRIIATVNSLKGIANDLSASTSLATARERALRRSLLTRAFTHGQSRQDDDFLAFEQRLLEVVTPSEA